MGKASHTIDPLIDHPPRYNSLVGSLDILQEFGFGLLLLDFAMDDFLPGYYFRGLPGSSGDVHTARPLAVATEIHSVACRAIQCMRILPGVWCRAGDPAVVSQMLSVGMQPWQGMVSRAP